jgi:hypothetical protein
MVMPYPDPHPDRMVRRFALSNSGLAAGGHLADEIARLAPPPWRIEIPAADGTMLLVLREEAGCLVAEYDESRVNEAARRFLAEMMRWAGGAGIAWKDEARG